MSKNCKCEKQDFSYFTLNMKRSRSRILEIFENFEFLITFMVFKLFREKVPLLSNNASVQNITMEQVAKSVLQDIIKMLMENALNVHVTARKYTKWPEMTSDDP